MDERTLGLIFIGIGLAIVLLGGALALGSLSWFGRLPGDIRFESDSVKVYVPLASMLLISVIVSLALGLFSRLR